MTAGIIFLNGPSSSGKTSLAQALQNRLAEPYLLIGLDTCFSTVPHRWAGGPKGEHSQDGIHYVEFPPTADGTHRRGIGYGAAGWRMLTGFQAAICELARRGNNVIVDEMLLDEALRDHWLELLADFEPLFVGLDCDLPELERRELARGNTPGLARWSAERVHSGLRYDHRLDSTHATPDQLAEKILGPK